MKIIMKASLLLGAAIAALLLLSLMPLARPQQSNSEDQFVGFYIVTGPRSSFQQDEHWVEDGEDQLSISGMGSVPIPREVLFGVTDDEGNITFPGTEGVNCFLIEIEKDGAVSNYACMDLAEPDIRVGDKNSLEGTLYLTPSQQQQITTFYEVYQKKDGRVYLDGSGNSYQGEGFSKVQKEISWEEHQDGVATDARSLTISVNIEPLEQLEKIVVHQFDNESRLLHSWSPEIQEDILPCPLLAETAWAVVEEYRVDGTIQRTLLTPEEEHHSIWFYRDEKSVSMTLELEWEEETELQS